MKRRTNFRLLFALSLLIAAIVDPGTAAAATKDGIVLCLNTVLPGIFIFLLVGNLISDDLAGFRVPWIESMLGIPGGTCGYFFIGQLCGYPVGAKLLQDACSSNRIPQKDAMRMIYFCNNASPAFIIGIVGPMFSNQGVGVLLWIIQMASSFLLAILTRAKPASGAFPIHSSKKQFITDSLRTAAVICGWIILFKILLGYIGLLLTDTFPQLPKVLIWGSLEATNGLLALKPITSEATRFIISSYFLSFGGVCVLLQTHSVAPDLHIRQYTLARLFHAGISCTLASAVSVLLFGRDAAVLRNTALFAAAAAICYTIMYFNQNNGSILRKNIV